MEVGREEKVRWRFPDEEGIVRREGGEEGRTAWVVFDGGG